MITDNTGGLPRYCHPYHGGWDVATIALNIPESRILFICPVTCARNICLNAINGGYKDRVDVLALTEDDIVSGSYEEKTVAAACEILDTVQPRPKAMILYVSCIDAMLGNDHSFQTEEIMSCYPDVTCFVLKMCPITRFSGDLPLVALQHDMYAPLPEEPVPHTDTVGFIGSNIALHPDNELIRILQDAGYRPLHIQACDRYEDYLAIRSAKVNLCLMPFGKTAGELLAERYGAKMIPYFARPDFASIRTTITAVCNALDIALPDLDAMEAETVRILQECAAYIGDTELVIDSTATLFPDILRKTLTACGFRIRRIYADGVQQKAPDIDAGSIQMPLVRSYEDNENVIAIGMAASSFAGADKTVNMFYDNGEWGHYALRMLAARIRAAYEHPRSAVQVRKEARK
ncbi:MAG: hypothetical protein IIY72_03810 [Solobacterium sp.]|nr:hypothetical protein [Solobacterium sp.]